MPPKGKRIASATKRAPARDSNRKNKKAKTVDKTEDETEVNMQNEDNTSAEEDIETRIEHSDLNGNQIDVDSDQDVQQVGKKLLLNFLSNQFEDDSSYLKSLKAQIFPIAKQHLEDKIDIKQKDITLLAAYLDPTTFNFLDDSELTQAEKYIITISSANNNLLKDKTNQAINNTKIDRQQTINKFFKFNSLIKHSRFNEKENNQACTSSNLKLKTVKEEIASYKSEICNSELDLSSFWKKNCTQLPLLASLVRKYLIIPASSVSSESSFSVANFIQRKERSALSSKSLKQAIILRSAAQNEIF